MLGFHTEINMIAKIRVHVLNKQQVRKAPLTIRWKEGRLGSLALIQAKLRRFMKFINLLNEEMEIKKKCETYLIHSFHGLL